MLPIHLIYQIICKYMFLERFNKVKNTLTDVIRGGKTYLTYDFCLMGPKNCLQNPMSCYKSGSFTQSYMILGD